MRKFPALLAVAAVNLATTAMAQGTTPNHVFQVTEQIMLELKQLNAENFSTARDIQAPMDEANPRHVLFLIRDQWRKVQLLRFINGLESNSLPPAVIRDVTPTEVKTQVDRLLIEVQALRSAYGLEAASDILVPLPNDKTPTQVYANLLRISAELDALGVPATVPNDVYRVAASIVENLDYLAKRENIDTSHIVQRSAIGRTPQDAYYAGLELISALKNLAEMNSELSVQGGIAIPHSDETKKTPGDVIVVLSRALADVMALMNAADTRPAMLTAPYEGGKTPSDVFNSIMYARHLAEAMAS